MNNHSTPPISRRHLLGIVGLGMVATSCGAPQTVGPSLLDLPSTPTVSPTSARRTAATTTTSPTTAAVPPAVDEQAQHIGVSRIQAARGRGLPRKVVGGYWPLSQPDAIRLRDLPAGFNLVYLFAGVPRGAPGEVVLDPAGNGRGAQQNLVADIAAARSTQGRSIVLSVGGAGGGIVFDSRATSSRFVTSVRGIVDGLGGIDGVDLNTFEADATPNLTEYSWISSQLKSAYGQSFAITAPPAPWKLTDRAFCKAMVTAGLLDLCGPQYYDGAGLATPDYITGDIGQWVDLVGADKLCIGFGVNNPGDYMTTDQCVSTWNTVRSAHPDIRGAFVWNVATDESNRWGFVNRVGSLVAG
jgi:chitinase